MPPRSRSHQNTAAGRIIKNYVAARFDLARSDDGREIGISSAVAEPAIWVDEAVSGLAVGTHVLTEAHVAQLFVRRAVVAEVVTGARSAEVCILTDGRKLVRGTGAVVVTRDGS